MKSSFIYIFLILLLIDKCRGQYPSTSSNKIGLDGKVSISGANFNLASPNSVVSIYFPPSNYIGKSSFLTSTANLISFNPQPYMQGTTFVICTIENCTTPIYQYQNATFNSSPIMTSIDQQLAGSSTTQIRGMFFLIDVPPERDFNHLQLSYGGNQVINTLTAVSADHTSVTVALDPSIVSGKDIMVTDAVFRYISGIYQPNLNFSFIAPTITNVTTDSGGNTYITGTSFGSTSNLFVITMQGTPVPSITTVTPTLITLPTPTLMKTAGSRQVLLNLNNNPSLPYTFVLNPKVSTVDSVPTSGGLITITGTHLDVVHADGTPSTITVNIGSVVCSQPTQISTGLSCTVPAGTGANHAVSIVIDGAQSNNDVLFSYGKPQLNSYTQADDVITVIGTSLGTTGTTKVNIYGVSTAVPATSVDASGSTLVFKLPLNAKNGNFTITAGTLVSNINNLRIIPIVSAITLSDTQGTKVLISGKFLDNHDYTNASQALAVTIGKNPCASPIYNITTSNIECIAPPGFGTNINATVLIDTKTSAVYQTFGYNKPSITSYYQIFNKIYLVGTNFGSNSSPLVPYSQTTYNGTNSKPDFEVFFVPVDTEKDNNASVTVGGQTSNIISIALHPSIESLTSVLTAGGQVSVTGHFIRATNNSQVNLTMIGTTCNNIQLINGTSNFTCDAAPGYGIDHTIDLSVNNISKPITDPAVNFTYLPPTIQSVSSVTEQGGLVTITGTSFYQGATTVKIGSQDCTEPTVTNYNNIVCTLAKWDFNGWGEIPDTLIGTTVSVGTQSNESSIFKFDLEALYEQRRKDEQQKRLKWLIPAIVVPCVVGLAVLAAVTVVLVKKHNKNKELKKMFRN